MNCSIRHGHMPPPPPVPPLVDIVLDVANPCSCKGCRKRITRALNKIPGVREQCYNWEMNRITLTGTVDPEIVERVFSKIKKHVSILVKPLPQPPPPPSHHSNAPPSCQQQGQPHSHCNPQPMQQGPPAPHTSGRECGTHRQTTQKPPQPSRHSVHIHVTKQGKGSECGECSHSHRPPRSNNGPPQPQTMHGPSCRQEPPRLPSHQNAPVSHRTPPPNKEAGQLENYDHGQSSRNLGSVGKLISHLAKIPKLKNAELINERGIKLSFQDGQVKSCHTTSQNEVRPGPDRAEYLPHPHQQQPRYADHVCHENPNYDNCTIM